ncbi:MAG TPA: rRNA maturation RNase YbeY [Acidimicrobiia bacterium]|nr:rRNA maturation RNase YbeY [Acidimicrobiia bacterium]
MTRATVRVFGSDEQLDIPVDVLRWVRLAELVLTEERVPPDAQMSVLFVDEQTIADLNARFLDGDGPTDVLAFPLDEEEVASGRRPDEGGRGPGSPADATDPPIVVGDVVVCPTVAKQQAEARAADLDDELALLVVHGTLHLLGYDHAEEGETRRMRAREQELLARFRAAEGADGAGAAGETPVGDAGERTA